MTLKQQQIAILQTWQSAAQGQEAVKQGKALPIFTMFTIIFVGSCMPLQPIWVPAPAKELRSCHIQLPLSFMTSIFGMNAAEFEDGAWSLKDELTIICKRFKCPPSRISLMCFSSRGCCDHASYTPVDILRLRQRVANVVLGLHLHLDWHQNWSVRSVAEHRL